MNRNSQPRRLFRILCLLTFLLPASLSAQQYTPDTAYLAAQRNEQQQKAEDFRRWAGRLRSDELGIQVASAGKYFRYGKVVWSPDGAYFLIMSDRNLYLVESSSGFIVRTLVEGAIDKHIMYFRFSDDGKNVIYTQTGGREDGNAINYSVFEIGSGRQIQSLRLSGHQGHPSGTDLSGDKDRLVTCSNDNHVMLWDLKTGRKLQDFSGFHFNYSSVQFSPRDETVLLANLGAADSGIKLLNMESGEIEQEWEGIRPSTWSPDGRYLAFTSNDNKTITLADAATGRIIRTFSHEREIKDVQISEDGRFLISNAYGKIYRWNIAAGNMDWESSDIYNHRISLTPDNSKIAITGDYDRTLVMLDAGDGKERCRLEPAATALNTLRIGPDGKTFYCCGMNGLMGRFDLATGRTIQTFVHPNTQRIVLKNREILDISITPSGSLAVSGRDNGTVSIWDIPNKRLLNTFNGKNIYGKITDVEISPDGRTLLYSIGGDKTIYAVDVQTGELLREIDSGTGGDTPRDFAYSPDGRFILSHSNGGMALIDGATGRHIRKYHDRSSINFSQSVAFTSDGTLVAGGGLDNQIHLYDMESGRFIRSFIGHENVVNTIAFSSDGRLLASGSNDRTLRLWEKATGKEILTLRGFTGSVNSLAFTIDGNRLLSCSEDGIINLWSIPDGRLIYSIVVDPKGNSVAWTPDGYFSGDKEFARKAVYIVNGLTAYSIDQFFDVFYRPDIVEATAAGRDISNLPASRSLTDGFKAPPNIAIKAERTNGVFSLINEGDSDYKISDGNLRIRVEASDQGGGVDEIRLFHNGTRVSGTTRGLGSTAHSQNIHTFTIQLSGGENRLRAVGFSDSRVESNPAQALISYRAPRRAEPTLWIISVGINEYRNGRYDLNYAKTDAISFIAAVEKAAGGLFKNIESTLLTDTEATRAGISSAIRGIQSESKPEDVFMFFFAGHGIALEYEETERSEFFFIPTDVTQMTDLSQVERLGLSGPEFEELISAVPARKQFMVLDACNSGAINSAFAVRGAGEEIALSRLSRATGSTLIAASREDQFAQEFATLGQGALTKAILNGLAGEAAQSNGQITVGSLKSYVETNLPELTEKYAGEAQFPTGFVFGQDFPIGLK